MFTSLKLTQTVSEKKYPLIKDDILSKTFVF